MVFPQKPSEKFNVEHTSLQKIFRTSLIALYIFFFSTCYRQKIWPLVVRPSEIIFFSFFAASQEIWSSVLPPLGIACFVYIFILHLIW